MAKQNPIAQNRNKTLLMVQTALLAAIEVVLTLIYIPVGTINLNFGLVPIVIAGICLSPLSGAFVGAVSGVVTMIQVITGQGVFYLFLMAENPIAACLLCIVKTTVAGFLSGFVYRLLSKGRKESAIGAIVSAVLCPVVNTGIFALGMLTIFADGLMKHEVISKWTDGGIFAIVFLALIGVNFFVELIVSLAVCPILSHSLLKTKYFNQN